jgi:protoporphyrinogen/coproporphyrinogen III oxidase
VTVAARVVVLGGGVAGLTAAYRVMREAADRSIDVDVSVLEAGPSVGGKIRSHREGEWLCESGPNGFLDNEPATIRLIDDLGISDQLQRSEDASRRRYLIGGGELIEMHMHPVKFLKSPLLSRRAKFRMGMEFFRPARRESSDESVGDFGRRRLGREFTEVMLDSMVSGIYAGDVDRLSVRAAFPKIVELEQEYGGLFKGMFARQKERRQRLRQAKRDRAAAKKMGEDRPVQAGPSGVLHSFRDGMQAPIDALAKALGPERVRTESAVARVSRGENFEISLADGEKITADAVIVALPASASAEILHELVPVATDALRSIELAGVHVVCLGFEDASVGADTAAFGALIPRREGVRTLGSIFSSSTFSGRAPAGHVLLTNMIGGRHDPAANDLSDEELVALVRRDLGGVLRLKGEPVFTRVFRWARGIPQYELGHLERVAQAEEAVADFGGLYLAGNSVTGVSFNQCILAAEGLAQRVLDDLAQPAAADEIRRNEDAI